MGCGVSSPGDAGLPGPSPVPSLQDGDTNGVQPRRRASSFDGIHGAILDLPPPPPPDQPTNSLFANSTLNPFRASNTIGIASSSWNMPDAARSTDSKFAPGAERSDSRSYIKDSARAVHAAVAVNPSFVHPDPALRSDVPSDEVSRRGDDSLLPSDIRVADFGGSSSPSEQSAGNGVICPEPTAHEWSALLARKRALAEFHGHTADPDQHTARLRVNIPSDVHATCAVWLREVDTIF